MRMVWIMAVAAVMGFALAGADVAGAWVGSMETPGGVFHTTIRIQAGEALAGTVTTEAFEGKIVNGKLDGDKIYLEVVLAEGKLVYQGTVAGDEMKLTVTGTTGNKYPMLCKREK